MRKSDTRDISKMPKTVAWLRDKIKGFAESYDTQQRAKQQRDESRAKAGVKPNAKE